MNFFSDFGGVGLVGSIVLLTLPVTEISVIAPIILSAVTLLGQGVVWYSRYQDRKDRKRRFNGLAEALEKKLAEKIANDSMTANDAETFVKFMEKLDDIDKG